jgi:membrane protein
VAFLSKAWNLAHATVGDFAEDDATTLGAALAFYSGLSFAPLVLILVGVAGTLGPGSQSLVVEHVQELLGSQAGESVTLVVEAAKEDSGRGWVASAFGIGALVFAAAGAFGQLQAALNRIWDVKPKPGQGVRGWLRKRVLSMGMVFAVAFLLMVSLAFTAGVALVFAGLHGVLWQGLNVLVSLILFTGLFALLFKYVPDVRIPWRVVRVGAVLTAVLFLVGKSLIGLYLGRSAVGSAYGAAGTIVVMLVWVYYSSLVLFLGAEATQAWARLAGVRIEPSDHAVWAEEEEAEHARRRREEERKEAKVAREEARARREGGRG